MYLLVFVFLMLSIIGLYIQVYSLQLSKMLANQKAIGQTMLVWHGGALAFARDNRGSLGTQSTDAKGCLLTEGISLGGVSSCGSLLETTATAYLPGGYQSAYQWYSIAYAPDGTGQQYVLTIATSTGGSVTLPTPQPNIGYSPAEILQQLKKSGAPRTAYGMTQDMGVLGRQFVTPDAPATPIPYYGVPRYGTLYYVPPGSVGLISPL
ncbi:MAG: hypothetical protein PHY92_09900 [Alphaproteobacteria bacterium]|nr:hypothetical protein [Alphaproteobacteria bacterium]